MDQAFHIVAMRVARAYKTVSRQAVAVLANLPPLELVAREYAQMYEDTQIIRRRGVQVTAKIKARLKTRHRQATVRAWKDALHAQSIRGQRVIASIQPVLETWVDRAWGGLTYRMTQIISGHGCFGSFLHQIGKEDSKRCHHCDSLEDTAQHTLENCPAWTSERGTLVGATGPDLSLPAVIEAILANRESWRAFSLFCEKVMLKKEEAERIRRGQIPQNRPRVRRRP